MVDLVKIFCKADTKFNLAIRDDKVVFAHADPKDKSQQWFKDYSGVGNLTDDYGRRAFALVNKATGEAMTNRDLKNGNPVLLAPYEGDERVDISMVWTEDDYPGDGFHLIRALRDNSLTFDGLGGHISSGTVLGLYYNHISKKSGVGANALWKTLPITKARDDDGCIL